MRTKWTTNDIWLRRTIDLTGKPDKAALRIFHDEDAEVYLNGRRIASFSGHVSGYFDRPLDGSALTHLKPGRNVLAVHCHQTRGGQYIDADLIVE